MFTQLGIQMYFYILPDIYNFFRTMCNPPGPHTATTRRSGSRTRDSSAGGGRSNKERQRLQPLASVARAPLFEVRRVRFYTQPLLAKLHPLHSPP